MFARWKVSLFLFFMYHAVNISLWLYRVVWLKIRLLCNEFESSFTPPFMIEVCIDLCVQLFLKIFVTYFLFVVLRLHECIKILQDMEREGVLDMNKVKSV